MEESPREDIIETNAKGRVIVREVLRLVLYLDRPHAVLRPVAREVIEAFVDLVALGSLHYTFDMEGQPQKLDAGVFADLMTQWFEGPASQWPNASIAMVGAGGNAPDHALTYRGKSLAEEGFPEERGYLDVWVPRGVFDANAARCEEFFLWAARSLGACAGYISPALAGANAVRKQAQAKRYYAVDIADPGSVSIDLGARSPGAYWLNYLGPVLARQVGEHEVLLGAGGASTMRDLPEGALLLRLGPTPIIGDRNRQQPLDEYRAYARFLDGRGLLHVPRQVVYFENEQALADADEQESWHRRFVG